MTTAVSSRRFVSYSRQVGVNANVEQLQVSSATNRWAAVAETGGAEGLWRWRIAAKLQ